MNWQGWLKHWFFSEIQIMIRFNARFDTHKWIDLAGADYLSDNDDFSMIFLDRCNRLRLLRTSINDVQQILTVLPLLVWHHFCVNAPFLGDTKMTPCIFFFFLFFLFFLFFWLLTSSWVSSPFDLLWDLTWKGRLPLTDVGFVAVPYFMPEKCNVL